MASSVDWNVHDGSGLVSIGTHSLYLRAAGPVRKSTTTPAVVCIAGLGDSSASWPAVLRHISISARCYIYDRTGFGRSIPPPNFSAESKSYVNIAKELRRLLDAALIKPPYLLVMHSMGGIPGREFFHLYPDDVAGMVFLDTNTEETYRVRPATIHEAIDEVWEGVDMSFLHTEHPHALSEDEMKALHSESGGDETSSEERARSAQFEVDNFVSSSDILAEKRQFDGTVLGDRPVSVIKGDTPGEFRRCFAKAVAAGKGTEEQRKLISDYLVVADELELLLQFKQLRLSRNSRLVEARESWHSVNLYQPDLVAREVNWCLDEFEKLKSK